MEDMGRSVGSPARCWGGLIGPDTPPPTPGILETDITFLLIFTLIFLISCYFGCE